MGFQLIGMGLLGELQARTYFESQGKASYGVRQTRNISPTVTSRAA